MTDWPHTLEQVATDSDTGEQYTQTLTALSVDTAVAVDVLDPSHVTSPEGSDNLALLTITSALEDSPGTIILSKEDLLVWGIGLVQRLAEDLGPVKVREVMAEADSDMASVNVAPTYSVRAKA